MGREGGAEIVAFESGRRYAAATRGRDRKTGQKRRVRSNSGLSKVRIQVGTQPGGDAPVRPARDPGKALNPREGNRWSTGEANVEGCRRGRGFGRERGPCRRRTHARHVFRAVSSRSDGLRSEDSLA